MKLEIIGFNIESCITAQEAGADRIELCDNPSEGGTTPSYGLIECARKNLNIELYVMIRPRGGDFLYSSDEYEIMKKDIKVSKQLGCDGVVFGILTSDGKVDTVKCESLVSYAYPLGVTFHRAFDRLANPLQGLEDIINIGCERILTSGLRPKANDGIALIKDLINQADERIIIMPGSGVTSENILSIAEGTGAHEFHSSASMNKDTSMIYINNPMNEKLKHLIVSKEEVQKMSVLLRHYKTQVIN